ncbi:hypothetical protein QFZ96_002699 [Paraburkholderia youngii]
MLVLLVGTMFRLRLDFTTDDKLRTDGDTTDKRIPSSLSQRLQYLLEQKLPLGSCVNYRRRLRKMERRCA